MGLVTCDGHGRMDFGNNCFRMGCVDHRKIGNVAHTAQYCSYSPSSESSTEGVNIGLTALIASTLGLLLWTYASKTAGIPVPTLLALSPTTGVLGLLELLEWRTGKIMSFLSGRLHEFWVISRFSPSEFD